MSLRPNAALDQNDYATYPDYNFGLTQVRLTRSLLEFILWAIDV